MVRTYSHEGVTSFWRGNFASVIRYFPQQALNFAFKDEIQKTFKVSKQASNKEKLAKNIVSGGCAGSLSLVFVQSIDYTRTRLGVDARNPAGQRQFTGIVDCYVKTVRADGLRSGPILCSQWNDRVSRDRNRPFSWPINVKICHFIKFLLEL